jgi:hypothetical protein
MNRLNDLFRFVPQRKDNVRSNDCTTYRTFVPTTLLQLKRGRAGPRRTRNRR